MKKIIRLSLTLVMVFCLLIYSNTELFKEEGYTIISPGGIKYVFLANEEESLVTTFGSRYFLGRIEGEKTSFCHLDAEMYTGIYSCEKDPERRTLVRVVPDSEWLFYYRKASLPKLDLTPDNCIRFELIKDNPWIPDIKHMTCNDGIVNPDDLKAFLADVRSQKTAEEAGLYNLVRKPDGTLDNHINYVAFGYFKDEPNLAIKLYVSNFNNEAYSIEIDGKEYVLPEKWYKALSQKND